MDFIGPLPMTKSGNDGIFVVVDMLTKLTSVTPIKTTYSAEKIATIIIEKIISRFGFPRKFISDRDAKFRSKFWQTLWKNCGTKIAMSTAYHPETDGLTE
jgi:hypothetical protein